jgi:chemotaxis protein CheD
MTTEGSPSVADSTPRPAPGGQRPRAYLHPGQLQACGEPSVLTTILGSCVSVCLWDPGAGAGGMSHIVLPEPLDPRDASLRFAAAAHDGLVASVLALGARRERLRAKLFGGAFILADPAEAGPAAPPLGLRNVEAARRLLARATIPIVSEDVGGSRGRKLVFHTHDGAAWVKAL